MQSPFPFQIQNQQLWLSPERLIFWENKKALILSDLHFGKTGHFRKSGIAVPPDIYKEDLQRLVSQIQHFQPEKLIIVGDFFHSHLNKELELFQKWRADLGHLEINLIKGNHDILHDEWYASSNIKLMGEELTLAPFLFVHDINAITERISVDSQQSTNQPINYYFSGHMHPGIRVSGVGKQFLSFPCFYFNKDYAVLPAFSRFTGLAMINPQKEENIFAIVKNKIVQLQ
jgi:uncharacterized protein